MENATASTTLHPSHRALIAQIATILEELGPFRSSARREEKWRTTEQLANDLFDRADRAVTLECVTDALERYEASIRHRLAQGLPADAAIRRATYPDRTTALPLGGSTKHHGQPWLGQPPAHREDEPVDTPVGLQVPKSAPCVFLSYTRQDADFALGLAHDLAILGFGSWMFETHIQQRGPIAACVLEAIAKSVRCLALVTRHSIASLWVLTELHTARQAGTPITLVVNTGDDALMQMLESVRFSPETEEFDLSVRYDKEPLARMKAEYEHSHSSSRANRYTQQAHGFLATLPLYLAGGTAIAYPNPPRAWHGIVPLAPMGELSRLIPSSRVP